MIDARGPWAAARLGGWLNRSPLTRSRPSSAPSSTGPATPRKLTRTVVLASFPAAIAVVDQIAVVAEQLDHHPNIDIRWSTLILVCTTHSAGGVTARDFELAARIEEIIAAAGS